MKGVLLAAVVALIVSLLGTPIAIRYLRQHGYGQLIRDDGPTTHHTKRGTPTMGGGVIIFATLLGYFAAHLVTPRGPTASGLLVLYLMSGLGLVGFVDDFIKISKQRSLGLRSWAKLLGQALVSLSFGILALQFHNGHNLSPASKHLSFIRDSAISIGPVLFVLWAYIMIAATSNGVNLTDGLDGLATGTCVMVLGAYVVIGVWQFGNACSSLQTAHCYNVADPLDLAVVAAGGLGVCFGFLWWNASPAQIFMGGPGSLSRGGPLSGLAILSRTELLLLILGGLFVLITTSVILQVGGYKMTKRRVFLMAPLQHHFELKGWNEVTIVIRFWVIAGLCVGLGLGFFYAEWVGGGAVG